MDEKEKTEDEIAFGKGAWVYCNQHLNAHQTGWCTVSVRDKVGLGIFGHENEKSALQKCKDWGFRLHNHSS